MREPLAWNRAAKREGVRKRVFCGSMMDIWDPEVPPEWRAPIWDMIKACPWLDFLLLSKRPEHAKQFLPPDWGDGYANVWLGWTTENQPQFDRRLPLALEIPCAIRFISYEPALGGLDISQYLPWIHWVIAGGESGPGARASNPEWYRRVRDICMRSQIPFFMKQWGAWAPDHEGATIAASKVAVFHPEDTGDRPVYVRDMEKSVRAAWHDTYEGDVHMYQVGKKAAGCELDGLEWKLVPAC